MAFGRKRKDPFAAIQACLQKRDYKGALDWFNTLLQKDRKNTQIRLRFADTLVLAGKKRDAVKQYRVVADELADKGFMIRAIAINKKILQLDPSQTEVHEKLAAMKEERSGTTTSASSQSLADVLHRPDAPFKRYSEPVAAAPPPKEAPPSPVPAPVPAEARTALPELSLEESMAMEFGTASEMSEAADEAIPAGSPEAPMPAAPPLLEPEPEQAPEVVPVSLDEPEEAPVSGGFSLDTSGDAAESAEPPVFSEDPVELGGPSSSTEEPVETIDVAASEAGGEGEGDIELSFEGIEASADESPEIVLDVVEADAADETVPSAPSSAGEPAIVASSSAPLGNEDSQEIEIIAFEGDTEPGLPAEGAETLMGALGEDIDSLIDSIISDVGSSAVQSGEEETPAPTHIPLFSDLTSSEFVDIALLLVRRVAKVGETIVREGDPGDSMFIVSTGEVRATIVRGGQAVTVATMKDGDFFGEMAVLSGEPRTATCTAVKATELLELSRENLAAICSRHPHVEAKIRLAYDERAARFQT